jgi:hypothetical protein
MSIEAEIEDDRESRSGNIKNFEAVLEPICNDLDATPKISADNSSFMVTIEFDNRFA